MLSLCHAFEWLSQSKIFMKILQDSLHTAGRSFEKSVKAAQWPISKVQTPNFRPCKCGSRSTRSKWNAYLPALKQDFGRIGEMWSKGEETFWVIGSSIDFHWIFLGYKHIALWLGSMGYAAIQLKLWVALQNVVFTSAALLVTQGWPWRHVCQRWL